MAESKLVRNERLKALAGIFNSLAVASIVSAGLAPIVAANMAALGTASLGYLTSVLGVRG